MSQRCYLWAVEEGRRRSLYKCTLKPNGKYACKSTCLDTKKGKKLAEIRVYDAKKEALQLASHANLRKATVSLPIKAWGRDRRAHGHDQGDGAVAPPDEQLLQAR